MKVVIVSENTYPIQSPRAFRTAELSEELARRENKVILYVRENDYDYRDYENRTNIKIKKIPTVFFLKNGQKYKNLLRRILIKLLKRLLEFPRIELVYRIPPILRKEKNIDLLISIACPHTIHMGIANSIQKNLIQKPDCWIADCGDPFMLNPMYHPPFYFANLEKKWCQITDYITVPTQASIDGYYPEFKYKIRIIPQGFNFDKTPRDKYQKNEIPTFLFAGSIYNGSRDPFKFIEYLASLDSEFRFVMYTKSPIPERYKEILGNKLDVINDKGRSDVIKAASKADFLINITNPSTIQIPSKLIDYALAKRPILNISTDFKEEKIFERFLKGDYTGAIIIGNIEDYNIKNVTNRFISLYESILHLNDNNNKG